ncbi:BTAD domain-containing putative transcriptional regulator [Kutzneria sp. CA-103260]|uniref:BTAD domain-containing putative transcriptional regulator n=1 Tax=Kutzneria sp. CA-103260 TaxID=2802641 RepID=UPI001BA818C0|nr:BTAD domain-containing putative transcriptional regulator [Kutzneria sp. CA-103260]QUQ66310.1 Bacterial transcriptional activator domain protein [Kutzneria sp. CA-103260]
MAELRFEVLGPVRVLQAGQELALGPGKQRAVLAALLLHANRPASTAAIIDAVWPDDPPANGPNVVQKHVAGLRKVLEPERTPRAPGQLITLTDAGYTLHVEPGGLDAEDFQARISHARTLPVGPAAEALRDALATWRGPALAGLDGPAFDVERTRLEESRANALEDRIDLELRLGQHYQAIGELRQLTVHYPYRERLRGLLMLALYRSGRQAEALAAFRDTRRQLSEELGIEPGDELQTLHDRMLVGDPALLLTQPVAPPEHPVKQRPKRSVNLAGWWLVAVPLLSAGFLTWAAFLATATKLQGWQLWLSTTGYGALVCAAFVVPWIGGTTHALLLRPRLNRRRDPAVAEAMAARSRRAEARRLLATDPALARELCIGRPDLPRRYDDGGLVDVNSVPEHVLSSLDGFPPELAVRVVTDRDLVGGFTSVDDLVARGLLTSLAAGALRDRLVFIR